MSDGSNLSTRICGSLPRFLKRLGYPRAIVLARGGSARTQEETWLR